MASKPDSALQNTTLDAPRPDSAAFDDNEQPTIVLDMAWFGEPRPASLAGADHAALPDELVGMYYHG